MLGNDLTSVSSVIAHRCSATVTVSYIAGGGALYSRNFIVLGRFIQDWKYANASLIFFTSITFMP